MHTNLWKDFMNEPMRALHEQQCRRESGRTAHNSDEWLPTADRLQTAAEARQGCSKLFTVITFTGHADDRVQTAHHLVQK